MLEGLVASIGGVDAALAKEASAALLAQVGPAAAGRSHSRGAEELQDAVDVPGAAAGGAGLLRSSVAALLLQLWRQEAG